MKNYDFNIYFFKQINITIILVNTRVVLKYTNNFIYDFHNKDLSKSNLKKHVIYLFKICTETYHFNIIFCFNVI
jgi:hypothetical protein